MEPIICSTCKLEKSLADFQARKDRKIGRFTVCKECIVIRRNKWLAENRQAYNATGYAWRERNPHYKLSDNANRRAVRRHAFVEKIDRRIVFQRDEGICYLCNKPADPALWHLDHKMPLSKGGLHFYENVAVTHPRCNMIKHAKYGIIEV